MMKDGKILYLEPGAISSLRTAGDVRSDPLSRDTVFRDIKGLDNLVWQHLLDCAEQFTAQQPRARVLAQRAERDGCPKCGGTLYTECGPRGSATFTCTNSTCDYEGFST